MKTAKVVIKSTPQEAYKTETATAFGKVILSATEKATNANFTVRGWLFKPFCEMVDKSQNVFIRHAPRSRNTVMKPREKAIMYTGIMNVADIESMIDVISKMEFVPNVAFYNPDAPRKQRVKKQRDNKKSAKPKRDISKDEKKPSKPANEQKTETKPKKHATIMIMLEKGYAEKLLPSIQNIVKDCDVKIVKDNILVTVKGGNPDDVVTSLKRVKVNKKELTLSVRK